MKPATARILVVDVLLLALAASSTRAQTQDASDPNPPVAPAPRASTALPPDLIPITIPNLTSVPTIEEARARRAEAENLVQQRIERLDEKAQLQRAVELRLGNDDFREDIRGFYSRYGPVGSNTTFTDKDGTVAFGKDEDQRTVTVISLDGTVTYSGLYNDEEQLAAAPAAARARIEYVLVRISDRFIGREMPSWAVPDQ